LRRRLYRKHRHGDGAASADHPRHQIRQRAIADPFGYPLRLRTSTKLGYKNAKWIKAIEVTNDFTETFWSKQGFNWFAGI
jgi:DMSO/TMAO reductase YedYZ molybdopterin-dependent catalytic subunit